MCFGGKVPKPIPAPPTPAPVTIPIIGSPEDVDGYGKKRKKMGKELLQIPTTKADTSTGLGIPGI